MSILQEMQWGQIYNSTISGSEWLKDQSVSPGRWAVGYNYLYILYRILNDVKPTNILELGLGQSTKLMAQYAAYYGASSKQKIHHYVVEHDDDWIRFFQKGFSHFSEFSQLVHLPLVQVSIEHGEFVKYKGFKEFIESTGQKFQLFSVDGPYGAQRGNYCRRDILECLPTILDDDFVMMFDDYGEACYKTTPHDVEKVLSQNGIPFVSCMYSGVQWKQVYVIASESWKFLTTL